jgi:SAM-dependent methyltransferase
MIEQKGDVEKRIQEDQYAYPYHYLPRVEDGQFSQVQYWSWGLQYLGGLQIVFDQLADLEFDSLLDVGCGDGRFLQDLHRRYPDVETLGVDYSARSIALAEGMNPDLSFEVRDLLEDPPDNTYDVVTAIEVLEHIEPNQCESFVSAIRRTLSETGHLILTVPHTNKPVNEKHYQHFDSEDLRGLLAPAFDQVELIPFDKRSLLFEGMKIFLGWRGKHFIINSPPVLDLVKRFYMSRCLYAASPQNCRRIAAVASKPLNR